MIPSGLVELTFASDPELQTAKAALHQHYSCETGENLTLTVSVGETTQQLAELFIRLRDAHIEPTEFSQKTPTLDDVFFKLIGSTKENK
jgi:ABC-2 type transport system ATP-binding protein